MHCVSHQIDSASYFFADEQSDDVENDWEKNRLIHDVNRLDTHGHHFLQHFEECARNCNVELVELQVTGICQERNTTDLRLFVCECEPVEGVKCELLYCCGVCAFPPVARPACARRKACQQQVKHVSSQQSMSAASKAYQQLVRSNLAIQVPFLGFVSAHQKEGKRIDGMCW